MDKPALPKQFDSAERVTGRPAGITAVGMQLRSGIENEAFSKDVLVRLDLSIDKSPTFLRMSHMFSLYEP
jgi:hypothetical protein